MHFVSLISVHDTGRMEIKVVWKCGKIYVFFTRTKFCVSNWVEKKMSEDFFFSTMKPIKNVFLYKRFHTWKQLYWRNVCVFFFILFLKKLFSQMNLEGLSRSHVPCYCVWQDARLCDWLGRWQMWLQCVNSFCTWCLVDLDTSGGIRIPSSQPVFTVSLMGSPLFESETHRRRLQWRNCMESL